MMEVEAHPFEPFLPKNARLLMLGTFPPSEKRWSVRFYYPNFINDMWRIVGLLFFHDKDYFVDAARKRFRLDLLIPFLREQGIALFDTATRIRRTTGTAQLRLYRMPSSSRAYPMKLEQKAAYYQKVLLP